MMNMRITNLELLEPERMENSSSVRKHRNAESLGISLVERNELPLWYDSTADLAAWEGSGLCVNE